ncbi:hypothetical protein GWK47_037093 [Chionoecetes opilio]|uniref:Uncharacterized protein n=1 Tax=Chionoecetes opilio TaxID=41210 RepID=A0A8J5CYT7_CHIOP|nr:hypothetical protein GWK47_037093 [Chionoecetes opilio]
MLKLVAVSVLVLVVVMEAEASCRHFCKNPLGPPGAQYCCDDGSGVGEFEAEGVLIAQSALDRVHSVDHLQSCAPMTASVLAVPISVVLTPASNTTLVCLRTDAQHLNPALHASPS